MSVLGKLPCGGRWPVNGSIGACVEVNESIRGRRLPATGVPWMASAVAPGPRYRVAKRVIDLAISLSALVCIAPLLGLVALLVKLDSKGPVFFVQDRIGYDPTTGKTRVFGCYKFRSMKHGADPSLHREHMAKLIRGQRTAPMNGRSYKLVRDPRITRVGAALRRTSLDELPQLINVIRGEMSIVGPRPAIPYEVELYEDWHRRRLQATPGITGWWQVRGRNQVTFDEAMRMDIYYVEHQSLSFDLKIMLLTPLAVLSGRGAG